MGYVKYIAFLGGVCLALLAAFAVQGVVEGFGRFNVRTAQQNLKLGQSYVNGSRGDDTAVGLALANIRLANGNYKLEPTLAKVFDLLQETRALIAVPFGDTWSGTDAELRATTYDAHLRHTTLTAQDDLAMLATLQSRAEDFLAISDACLVAKRSGDEGFYAGVQQLDANRAQEGLATSLEQAPCYITNRIQANAYAYLAAYLRSLTSILVQRQSILAENKEIFLHYPELFVGDTLEKLLVLKQQMLSIRPLDEPQARSSFNFFMFTDTTQLPTFDKVFFAPDEIPTFQDPGIVLRRSAPTTFDF